MKKSAFMPILALAAVLSASCGSAAASVAPGTLRSAPYPYKALLAVCSDIDGATIRKFEAVHRYLNTEEETYLGTGLGLDVADSFWMFAVNDSGEVIDYNGAENISAMSYYMPGAKELKHDKEIIRYFDAGWIDSIHSYGDFSRVDEKAPVFTRKHAELANAEMQKNSLLPAIWINHGNAANVQNFLDPKSKRKKHLAYQQGANPASEYYHADITVPAGIRYIWFSNFSSDFSVETPLYPVTLEDGRRVWGFNRYTGETEWLFRNRYNWSVYGFNEQVSEKHLNKLVSEGGAAVVAQHLEGSPGEYIFTGETREGFERLKRYEENGDVLVARTARLLEFVRVRDYLRYDYAVDQNGAETITIHSVDDPVLGTEPVSGPEGLRGISFNVSNPASAKIYIDGELFADESLLFRSAGEPGVIGFKWYEKDFTDYTLKSEEELE